MSDGHVLVLGGARSGKTGFAERLAMRAGQSPAYLATAEALDGEMSERVRTHQEQRKGRFATIEEPLELTQAVLRASRDHDVILVDCLTLWITNMLMANRDVAGAVDELVLTLTEIEHARVILVSNEVGLGIVPDNKLARDFRDAQGRLNQAVAQAADHAIFMAAGLPLVLK